MRKLILVGGLMVLSLAAGVAVNSFWRAQASGPAAAQLSRYDYAVITNLRVTSNGGKIIATAWVRYLNQAGADAVGVNRSVALTVDFPKDDAAVRRWLTTTNGEESVNLTGVNLTAEALRSELFDQVKREAVARAFAKLGEEGFEMVGQEPSGAAFFAVDPLFKEGGSADSTPLMIYFKRRAS